MSYSNSTPRPSTRGKIGLNSSLKARVYAQQAIQGAARTLRRVQHEQASLGPPPAVPVELPFETHQQISLFAGLIPVLILIAATRFHFQEAVVAALLLLLTWQTLYRALELASHVARRGAGWGAIIGAAVVTVLLAAAAGCATAAPAGEGAALAAAGVALTTLLLTGMPLAYYAHRAWWVLGAAQHRHLTAISPALEASAREELLTCKLEAETMLKTVADLERPAPEVPPDEPDFPSSPPAQPPTTEPLN